MGSLNRLIRSASATLQSPDQLCRRNCSNLLAFPMIPPFEKSRHIVDKELAYSNLNDCTVQGVIVERIELYYIIYVDVVGTMWSRFPYLELLQTAQGIPPHALGDNTPKSIPIRMNIAILNIYATSCTYSIFYTDLT
jgi:hypothetical protein